MATSRNAQPGRDWVAVILAIGISTAINIITFAVLYDAIFSAGPGLSENATQIITAAFGGITGILGGYIGFKAGAAKADAEDSTTPTGPATGPSSFDVRQTREDRGTHDDHP